MKKLFLMLLALNLLAVVPDALAAKTNKPQAAQKERLVLMPLRIPEEDKNLAGAMESALVEGLQQKYTVFSGEQVSQKARQIFNKESHSAKKECDETRCMQGIAEAFQAELIATANVTKQDGGYFLALSVQNIFDNKVEYSKTLTCEGCSSFKVVERLKELVGKPASVAAPAEAETPQPKVTATDPESITWNEAQKGNSIDDYQVYLDSYPKGKYIAFAKAKIKKIKEAQQAAQEQQEQSAWDTAQQENSEQSLNRYLQGYPNGRFAGFAKSRLGKLKTDQTYKEESDLWQKAEAGNDQAAVESYLNKYPAGRYIAAASAKLKAIKEEAAKFKEPVMVRIPGKNYELGKYEVTQKEWRDIMGSNPSQFSTCGDNCPVEQVSWDDIQIYLQKLNTKSGRQYRLPTETEWEYACRGGKVEAEEPPRSMSLGWGSAVKVAASGAEKYCGSNDIDSVAWYDSNSYGTTHLVGQKQANSYGLYDMSGNVWEWMSDCWEGDCSRRALRGGSWSYRPGNVRSAERGRNEVADRDSNFGFRLAKTLP